MIAQVWTKTKRDCTECERVKTALLNQGYSLEVTDIESISKEDNDAHVQLYMQDGRLPVVRINGKFMNPEEVK